MTESLTTEFRKKYIVYMRAVLTLIVLLLGIYNYQYIVRSVPYVGFFLVIVVLTNFIFIYLPASMYDGIKLHYIIFLLDIIIIALSAYWLTKLDMQVFMVIFVTIFISALSQSSSMSVFIAIAANALYIFLKIQMGEEGLILTDNAALLNMPFIFVVALHSSYLAEKAGEDVNEKNRLRKSNKVLSDKVREGSLEHAAYIEYTERIFDSFVEGIMILDGAGVIRVFSSKCERMFNTRRSKVLHMTLRSLEIFSQVKSVITNLSIKRVDYVEEEISIEAGGLHKKAILTATHIKDRSGNKTGVICSFRHVPIDFGKGHKL